MRPGGLGVRSPVRRQSRRPLQHRRCPSHPPRRHPARRPARSPHPRLRGVRDPRRRRPFSG
jgi:hypothetical protein